MKQILIILFLLLNSTVASDKIKISYSDIALQNFNIVYIHDDNNRLTIDKVIGLNFKNTPNQNSFTSNHKITWYKIKISNTTSANKTIYLHNNLAYMSKEINIFEFYGKKQVDQNRYNLFNIDISKQLRGSTLVYPVLLAKNSTKTIFIKNEALIHQLIDLSIYDEYNSIQALINKNFYSNMIIFILFSLAIYNLILSLFSKQKEFAYYALYLLNASIGLFYMYGSVFHNLNIYGSLAYQFNITAILVSVFLVLFIKAIFDTHLVNKRLHTILNTIIYFALIDLLIALFFDLNLAMKIVNFVFLYTFIIILYTGVYFYRRKHPLAKIFLLAYFAYILGMGITIASLEGFIPHTHITLYASGIGLIFEALLFAYLLNFRIKLLEQEIVRHQNSLIIKNKKAQLGDMIGAITHQWKQPLSVISSASTLLQYKLEKESKLSKEYLELKLEQINSQINFLVETIDDFKHFFNPQKVKEEVDVAEIINRALSLSYDDMLAYDIIVKTDLNFKKSIEVYPNELLHIVLNLMQNAKEAFISNKIESRIIKIIGTSEGDKIIIDIIDNAGGIPQKYLSKIFNESYTTKENKNGSGLGLYLTRVILKDHLNGSIEVKQIENGTIFRIIL